MSENNQDIGMRTKRRNVLKGMVASAGGGLVGVASPASATQTGDVVGIAYDTLTDQFAGTVSGHIVEQDDQLRGDVNIAGFNVPLQKLEERPTERSQRTVRGKLTDEKLTKNGDPLSFKLSKHADHFSGTVTRPGSDYGMLGYFLFPSSRGIDVDHLAERQQTDSRWADMPHSFDVPKTGIPTDTGVNNLMEIAIQNASKGGDR